MLRKHPDKPETKTWPRISCRFGFVQRLVAFDARMVTAGLAKPGEASEHVTKAALVAHFPPDMSTWNEAQVSFAIATAKGFEAMRRQAKAKA